MKIFFEKEKTLQIDSETKLILLNVDEFVSTIKKESNFVPARHIKVSLKYKLAYDGFEYYGESIFDSNKDITNEIDDDAPYKVELINWKLSDESEKYLEFNIQKKVKKYEDSSYGTFVNISSDEIKKYVISEDITKIKLAKLEAFNWIKNCKNFEITKIEYTYSIPGYHDERGTSNTVEKTINDEYDDLASIFFSCKKDNEMFTLKPTFKNMVVDDIMYAIPEIEIYHYSPEKIGLINM